MVDAWPATLPQRFQVDGFSQTMGDGRLRSSMDAGPAKVRRRSSFAPEPMAGSMEMRSAQVAEAKVFIKEALLGGSLAFTIGDPMTFDTGQRALVRIVEMPSVTPIGADWFTFALNLEVLDVLPPDEIEA